MQLCFIRFNSKCFTLTENLSGWMSMPLQNRVKNSSKLITDCFHFIFEVTKLVKDHENNKACEGKNVDEAEQYRQNFKGLDCKRMADIKGLDILK